MNILAKNLLILASAGSGKTFQLGNRVIGLITRGCAPETIIALTFTRKAAGEFADSVLTKLAESAASESAAAALRKTLAQPDADFGAALEQLSRALPSLTLGTIDGFFSKIVRSFQYELGLTGGKFDLLEGPRAAALADELLTGILGTGHAHEAGEEFFHAFRRATMGREDQGVLAALRAFVNRWHGRYQESRDLDWGPAALADVGPEEWEKQKSGFATAIRRDLDRIVYTRSGQREALEKEIRNLENHTTGSGSLGSTVSGLMASILQAAATPDGPMVLKFYKEFVIDGPAGETLRRMVRLAARCELAAALQRTRSIRMVIASFDALCAKRLRSKGMLGFHDVKLLMGEWAHNEQARLRREAVDFRLDSRIHHWLLDEFQDTSRADWNGLQPLIDEAATNDENSVFIVGDRKQAIYAWRGGDVSLFDEIILQYGGNLDIESMAESWRSCPEVLHLVNQVCGDKATAKELFGKAADRWDWQDHFPAEPLGRSEKAGEARVEVVGDWDERLERMAEILTELGIGERAMTCGILLRGNKQARDVTDFLRNRGFDVIEEGRREPAKDNPVGIVIAHLLEWLADPADAFSRAVIEMSPVSGSLQACYGSSWPAIWEGLTLAISEDGFAETIAAVIRPCSVEWSAFGQRRAGDLLAALAALDTQGGVSPQEAADWIRRLEIPQNPGIAAVQVMTIHKAKGLGFDVVILPEVPDETVPQPQYFEVADGPGWLTQTPPKWARALIPEMSDAELRWAADQQYESFCLLYVALTRAKRGLYLLLDAPSKTRDPQKASLANWVVRSLGGDFQPGVLHQTGNADWPQKIPMLVPDAPKRAPQAPGPSVSRRETHTPTNAKAKSHRQVHSPSGMRFGSQVHEILEHISWLDETAPRLPDGEAGAAVARLLENPALHKIFVKDGRAVQLFREQHVDAIIDGRHITGIIDRLHLHQDSTGRIGKVEVMDFKTDAVKSPAELVERYSGQMECYRKFMQAIYPEANVSCLLVSVNHASAVDF